MELYFLDSTVWAVLNGLYLGANALMAVCTAIATLA